MGSYLVRRFGLMLLTLFGISVIIFVMLRIAPGNIADILFDAAGFVDPAEKAQIMKDLGLDKSLPVQYASWIGGLMQGDLGFSYVTDRPAIREILPRIPITAKVAVLALILSAVIGIPLGVISAVKQNTRFDYVLRVFSLSALSMPNFWLGLLVLMFSVAYFGTIPIYSDAPHSFWAALAMYSVPAAVVGVRSPGLDIAADPLVDARSVAPGLYPHRALQGRLGERRQLPPCAEERGSAGRSPFSASRPRS